MKTATRSRTPKTRNTKVIVRKKPTGGLKVQGTVTYGNRRYVFQGGMKRVD